jgi:hypothetical protein
MYEDLLKRIDLYFASLPPPTGRTFHQMQPETLLSECRGAVLLQATVINGLRNDIGILKAALQKISSIEDEHINAPKTDQEAAFWATLAVCVDIAEAALAGEKKDE